MPIPCPHLAYQTQPAAPEDEVADLLEHLGSKHYEELKAQFDGLAAMMRSLPVGRP